MKLWFKNVALFLLAPWIALAYLIALPFFGLYMFINLAVERSGIEVAKKLKETTTCLYDQ